MGALNPAKLKVLETVFAAAPDAVIQGLKQAFSSDGPKDEVLLAVRTLLEAEMLDRRVRNLVLISVAALCRPSVDSRLSFPPRALSLIWTGLKYELPAETRQAITLLTQWSEDKQPTTVLDLLCLHAAEQLRIATQGAFAQAAAACNAQSSSLSETLSVCLELSSISRRSVDRVPDWLGRMTEDKSAELRLAYRDVCTICEHAGPIYFEILSAHMTEPWHILRIIAAVMERPAEAYLAGSELNEIAERLLGDVDDKLALVAKFNADETPAMAKTVAEAIDKVVRQISEIEQAITLNPVGVWGKRVIAQKKGLAAVVEGHLRSLEDVVAKALPSHTVRLGPRTLKGVPRLSSDPEDAFVARATTLLSFAHAVRHSAATGGFASMRTRVLESIFSNMDQYVEDLLEQLRSDEEPGTEIQHHRARAYLEVVAGFNALARDEKAAQIVRRRAAAA